MLCATQRVKAGMTANPNLQSVFVGLPMCVRLPARFVEIGRGPRRIVAGAPDTLARRDSDDGLRRELNWNEDDSDSQQSGEGRQAAGKHGKSIPCRMSL